MPFTLAIRSGARAAALAATLALAACGANEPPPEAPRLVAVIAPEPLSGLVGEAYPGSVRARTESRLSFRVPGKIVERRVDIGSHVRKGQVLAVMDPQDARLNVEASAAAVSASEADVRLAEAEHKRHQELFDKGFISRSLLDIRSNELDLARARLEQARSQLAVIRNQAGYTTLAADADGLVTEVLAEAGQVVAAGQPVLGFARDGEREVVVSIPEGRIDVLRNAPQLGITLWAAPGKVYSGRVREIAASADRQTRTHEARVSFVDADDAVRLGMTANVIVGNAAPTQTFRLPLTAVTQLDGKAAVWAVREAGEGGATAQPVPVQVLQYLNDAAVVTGELKPDDRLVSAGVHLLTPGMAVRPLDRKAPVAL